ncbi:MAG: DNA double-strand break repair nuclease NurA, partial [Halobacteriales archaeon]|nr:DNA double-strand break repair nuclease NurA [Halobacteriales archaeon]
FRNGLVLDVAQAAMSASPSDLDLHRSRTVVATVHSHDATVHLPDAWDRWDQGFSRGRVLRAPRVDQYEEAVVHALSLYYAESSHALHHGDDVEDLLVLDGPLYPTGMVNWLDRHPELAALLADEDMPREVVQNYLTLVEDFVGRDVPLLGFVKTVSSKAIRLALAESLSRAPWADDASFFAQVLGAAGDGPGSGNDLLATNWFVSRGGTDRVFAAGSGELGIDRSLSPSDYEVTFCMVYDPRTDLVFKAEAPHAFTKDRETRERLTRYLLSAVATSRGPPEAVQKADVLARISAAERESLIETLERTFQSGRARSYDEERWGDLTGD